MDAENVLEAMKVELEGMRYENIYMEERLIALEKALEEHKRLLAEYKAIVELTDHLLSDIGVDAGFDNENNGSFDEETIKSLIEEAVRDFTEALDKAQSRPGRPGDGDADGQA
ncbi:Transposase [Gossypium arboreum]|uniref:Transposase n=1 Tax=Gossypium arboreum TaxID=29729 RepID=A0A0B0NNM8_GOSAR|nr:Transposase [Gossypium arboreum]